MATVATLAVAANAVISIDPQQHRLIMLDYFRGFLSRSEASHTWDRYWGHYTFESLYPYQIHLISGTFVFCSGPLQLWSWVRLNFPRFHKRLGYLFVVSSITCTSSALWLGWKSTLGSHVKLSATSFSLVSFFTIFQAIAAIWKGRVSSHQRWVKRHLAVNFGIVMVRLVATTLFFFTELLGFKDLSSDVSLTAAHYGIWFWVGFIVSVLLGEALWVRH